MRRISVIIMSLIMCLAAVPVSAADYSAYSNVQADWGLTLHTDHTPPVGTYPPGVSDITPYHAYYKGEADKDEPVIYLTFDCGYENGNTAAILDTLKKNKLKATFFITKPFLEENPDLVKRMKKEGHLVGNHTATHPNLASKSPEQIQNELKSTADKMKELTGYKMDKFIRPPAGQYSIRVLKVCEDMGYKTIFWSLAWYDYNVNDQPSISYVLDRFEKYHFNGLIPLMHNTSTADTGALPQVISLLKSKGYRFGTLDELGKKKNRVVVKVKKENEYTGDPVKISVKKKAGKVKLVYYDRNKKKLKKAPTDPGVYYVRAKVSATKEYRKIISGYVKYKILKPHIENESPDSEDDTAEGDEPAGEKNTTEPFSLIQ